MPSLVIRRAWHGWRTSEAHTGPPVQTGYNTVKQAAVTINFDEPLRASPAVAQFAATVNGVARVVNAASTSGSKLLLTLASAAAAGTAVRITYTQSATAGERVADAAGTAIASPMVVNITAS